MKIEINHPENLSPPPPRNLSNPLNNLNTTEIFPAPAEKIPNTSESISTPQKKIKPLPEKLPLPKNSITITETISNTRPKSQPLPEKSQPLVKNSQTFLKKSQPTKIFFNPP